MPPLILHSPLPVDNLIEVAMTLSLILLFILLLEKTEPATQLETGFITSLWQMWAGVLLAREAPNMSLRQAALMISSIKLE